MTQRAFNTSLILLAAVVWLSGTSFPGGMLGILLALAFVFCIGVPAVFVVITIVQAWRLLQQRDLDKARSAGFGVAVLLALPLIGWLSLHAMTH